jgi:hypothetical protein
MQRTEIARRGRTTMARVRNEHSGAKLAGDHCRRVGRSIIDNQAL